MSVKLILPALLCLALGYGIGSIPGVRDYVHWNLWYFIPISGLVIGMAMGYLSFKLCYAFNLKTTLVSNLILALSASMGYLAVDYGLYKSYPHTFQKKGDTSGQVMKLSEVMSFYEYMKLMHSSMSIESPGDKTSFEMGSTASIISFGCDLLGAFLGSLLILSACANTSPYCDDCNRYKSREKNTLHLFPLR